MIINYAVRRRERIGAAVGADIGAKGSRAIVRHKASTAPFLAAATIVDVLVPVALDQSYSYRVPAGLDLAPGDVVRVPLGARETTGVVWADNVAVQPGLHNRLRDVAEKLDVPPLREELRQFVDWVAGYTLSSRGMVLRMA
ncbi:MAG TPA: hypothetical protein VIH38_05480, partial [Steroidobacteraceae bacterium]